MTRNRVYAIGLLVVTLFARSIRSEVTLPERGVRAVAFDVIIEFRAGVGHHDGILFARYWVSRDYYEMAVNWCEPLGLGLNFSLPPESLTIAGSSNTFELTDEIIPEYSRSFTMPFGSQGAFTNMFGDYNLTNLRFAAEEAVKSQVAATNLNSHPNRESSEQEILDFPIPTPNTNSQAEARHIKLFMSNGVVQMTQFLDDKGSVLNSTHYDYAPAGDGKRLIRATTTVNPAPVTVALPGNGIKVTLNGHAYQFKNFTVMRYDGGRVCTVQYEPVGLESGIVTLPVSVAVRSGKDHEVLRSAYFTNFHSILLSAGEAKKEAMKFAGLTSEDREYRELLTKYWHKESSLVSQPDAASINKLRHAFSRTQEPSQISLGAQLKCLDSLMDLERLQGRDLETAQDFKEYMRLLSANGFTNMIFEGGCCAIQRSVHWGRFNEANELLTNFLSAAMSLHDANAVKMFARNHLQGEDGWISERLLRSMSEELKLNPSDAFEIYAFRCLALHQLKAACFEKGGSPNPKAKNFAKWVSGSITFNQLNELLTENLAKMRLNFLDIHEPSSEQRDLKIQVDKVVQLAQRQSNEQPQQKTNSIDR